MTTSPGQLAARAASLARIATNGLREGPIEDVLEQVVTVLVDDLDVELAGILEFDRKAEQAHIRAVRGLRPVGPIAIEREGWLATTAVPDPIVVEDTPTDPRMIAEGVAAGMLFQIRVGGVPWGALAVGSRTPRRFSDDDRLHLVSVAGLLILVIEREAHSRALERDRDRRRRLTAAALRTADAERRRIAEVLHDELLQNLLFARQECADGDVASARLALDEATLSLRRLIGEVHPVALAHAGLGSALATLAEDLSRRGGFTATVEVESDTETALDPLIVGLTRELLTNVGKHARASRAEVVVDHLAEEIVVSDRDDGVGLDADAPARALDAGHVGLASAIERVEVSGGRLSAGPGIAGRGTGVVIRLPR